MRARLFALAALGTLGAAACNQRGAELQGSAPASASTGASSAAPSSSAAPPQRDVAKLVAAIDGKRLEADVRFVAKPRPPGSEHHRAVAKLCEERFRAAGLTVSRQRFASGENVIGEKKGSAEKKSDAARTIVLSAHYDHIPMCSGADDNATGVAVVLEAARVLGAERFPSRLVLACWDDEEAGLNGSMAYAVAARERKDPIALAIALDGVGFTNSAPGSQTVPPGFAGLFPEMTQRLAALNHRAVFAAVIGDSAARPGVAAIERQAGPAKLEVISATLGTLQRLALLDAARSDHASFWLQGYPALLVTDTANFRNPRYHCGSGDDNADSLDYAFVAGVARAVTGAVAELLERESSDATER
jgi:hypothetical protein